jgi:predicted kinase
MTGRLIIIAGCAGSGKSTYAGHQFPGALVVSADHYFESLAARSGKTYREVWDLYLLGTAHSLCQEKFAEAIAANHPVVIVDNINVRASDRQRFVKVGLEHKYEVEIHVLSPLRPGADLPSPEEVAAYVNLCHGRNVHGVPRDVIAQQLRKLDLPSGVYGVGKPSPYLRPLDKYTGKGTPGGVE